MPITQDEAKRIAQKRFASSDTSAFELNAVKGGWYVSFEADGLRGQGATFVTDEGEVVQYSSALNPERATQEFESRQDAAGKAGSEEGN